MELGQSRCSRRRRCRHRGCSAPDSSQHCQWSGHGPRFSYCRSSFRDRREVGLFKGAITEILSQQIEGRQSLDWGRIAFSSAVDMVLGAKSGLRAGEYASQMVDYQYLLRSQWTYPYVSHLDRSAELFIKGVLGGMGKYVGSKVLWPWEVWAPGSTYQTWRSTGGYGPPSRSKYALQREAPWQQLLLCSSCHQAPN